MRQRVSQVSDYPFNAALLNLYRDGNDSVGWHSDNEKELGARPVVATLSLGAERRFDLRPCRKSSNQVGTQVANKARIRRKTSHLYLPHGSLLIMAGDTQNHWQHRVARTKGLVAERISLTFRYVYRPATGNFSGKDSPAHNGMVRSE
jgi:alkylated DNA repair dioxygenase AlkB